MFRELSLRKYRSQRVQGTVHGYHVSVRESVVPLAIHLPLEDLAFVKVAVPELHRDMLSSWAFPF